MKFLVVSRLEKVKNIDIVIDVFNELKNDELWIVGKGRYENELKRKVKGNNIKFFGYVSEEKLKKLFRKADVCIMPHINEPFGLVPYEIAKFGKPSIISKLSGIAHLTKKFKFGLIFNPLHREDLIKKMKKIKNRNIYRKLKKNAIEFVRRITPEKELRKLIVFFKNRKNKKILIIHSQFYEIGGAEKSMLGLYKKINQLGLKCDLLFDIDAEQTKKNLVSWKSKIKRFLHVLTLFRVLFKIRNKLKKENYDFIILSNEGNILSLPSIWSVMILKVLYKKFKLLIYYHHWPSPSPSYNLFENIILYPLVLMDILIFRLATFLSKDYIFICNSELTKYFILKRYRKKINIGIVYPIFHT